MNIYQVKVKTEHDYMINGYAPEAYNIQEMILIVKDLMDQLEHLREKLHATSKQT